MILSSFFSNGAGSSSNVPVDVYNKVSKIMQAQNTAAPKLNAALTADKTTLSGLGQLQSALASFQGVVQALAGKGVDLSAYSSAKTVLTASTSSRSVSGVYAIQVSQLAQSQVLRSSSVPSQDTAIGGGAAIKINFEFGNASENAFATGASPNPGKTVVIPSGGNTLKGIAAAVNDADIGVNARVVPSGTGYALEFVSPSGAANSLRIGVSNDPTLQDFLEYDPAGAKKLSQTASAQNAVLTINGVAMESPGNAVTGAIPGTTLNLAATGTSKLTVAQGSEQFIQNVTSLVNAYNDLNAKLGALGQGDLKEEGSVAHIQARLARIFTSGANDAIGMSSQALAKIGIAAQKNGDLSIDATKLQNAISTDPTGITQLFANGGKGMADSLASQVRNLVGPDGSIPRKTAAINQDIAALNAKKSSLEKSLTAQANALVKYYSQQNNSTWNADPSASRPNSRASLLDFL